MAIARGLPRVQDPNNQLSLEISQALEAGAPTILDNLSLRLGSPRLPYLSHLPLSSQFRNSLVKYSLS